MTRLHLFICRHARVYQEVRNLPQRSVGAELRDYLYEDTACLVEDYLFSRTCFHDSFAMLQECADEEDFDGILYTFCIWGNLRTLIHTSESFERQLYHSLKSVRVLELLLLFTTPPRSIKGSSLVVYSIHGRCELLRRMCEVSSIPLDYVGIAIFELRYCKRDDRVLPKQQDGMTLNSTIWPLFATDEDFSSPESRKKLQNERTHGMS